MGPGLSIVSYNIHNGKKPEDIINNITDLASKGVGVFCLQELRQIRGEPFLLDSLLKELGTNWEAEHLIEPESHHLGLCTLWNKTQLQPLVTEGLLLPQLPKVHFYERALEKVVGTYPLPFQRAALIVDFIYKQTPLRVANLHLDWQGGYKHKILQLRHVRAAMQKKTKIERQIFCGDFNTLGFYRFSNRRTEQIVNLLGRDFTDAFKNARTTSYMQMLDHVFVKNLDVVKAKVIKCKGSDHYPLLAEVMA